MEQRHDQGGAKDFLDLLAAHSGLQRLDLLLGNEISLHNINLVWCDGAGQTMACAVKATASGQPGTEQNDGANTDAVTGRSKHG
ncbi:hypothetical protein SDC9_150902 [bioreactor metagenome]|uniref:Uncharacterized protein n=1 Tax=bioreactor metagenome TaxID=1076179 RepID=A0A645EQP4_9ZZZZ